MCMFLWGGTCVEVKSQLLRIGFLLSLCRHVSPRNLTQTWQQIFLSTEPSCQPLMTHFLCVLRYWEWHLDSLACWVSPLLTKLHLQVFVLTMLCSTLTFDLPFSWTQTFRLHSPPRIIFQLITFVFRQFPFHNAYQPLSPPPPCHLFSPSSSLQISPALSWPLCLVPHWD